MLPPTGLPDLLPQPSSPGLAFGNWGGGATLAAAAPPGLFRLSPTNFVVEVGPSSEELVVASSQGLPLAGWCE